MRGVFIFPIFGLFADTESKLMSSARMKTILGFIEACTPLRSSAGVAAMERREKIQDAKQACLNLMVDIYFFRT
jgi:hypothetical protein